MPRRLLPLLGLALLWEVVPRLGWLLAQYCPPLSAVAVAFGELLATGELVAAELQTLWHALSGFAAAAVVGVGLAVLTTSSPLVDTLLEPLIEFLRPLPPAALIPISIFFIGVGTGLYVFSIGFAAVWPIYVSTQNALRSTDRTLLDTGASFGCRGLTLLREIKLPHAAPEMFTGLRVSMGVALIATVVAEMLAGRGGIGFLLFQTAFSLRIAEMYAGIVVAGLNGLALNWLILRLRWLLLGWHETLIREHLAARAAL